MMEALGSSETSVLQEPRGVTSHRRENLKSYMLWNFSENAQTK
jgi:hypothetical protein